MNIVFFGSDKFALPSLEALVSSGHKISCVVTQPDKKTGRGLHLGSTSVKKIASELGLQIYQPISVNSNETIGFLKGLQADLFVVIAYGQILSEEVLSTAKVFAINIHASLLPLYRGAAPINWVLINGEKNTGVSAIKLIKRMDAGPIIMQKSLIIDVADNAVTLEEKLATLGAGLLMQVLDSVSHNSYKLINQDDKITSLAPKLRKKDGEINWFKSATEIVNLVRGCFSWPGAFTYYQGKILKIYKAIVINSLTHKIISQPGQIIEISPKGIIVATGSGSLLIEELQPEGKRRMNVADFISGHKISLGELLGKK